MSRTDVHRPAWVQCQDTLLLRWLSPCHWHITRDCWDADQKRWLLERLTDCDLGTRDGRCQYWTRGRNLFCGCPRCTGQPARHLQRRQERTTLRAQLRTAVKTPPDHLEDLDLPLPGRAKIW